jgi:hypothetical protein
MTRVSTVLLAAFVVFGCASAPPPWRFRYLDGLSRYYEQGSGVGATTDQADVPGWVHPGHAISGVTENQSRSVRQNGDEVTFELTTVKRVEKVSGVLPPQTCIAERWRANDGSWWSIAVNEKPGAGPEIRSPADQRLRLARLRAVVPGWAQFTKREPRKGWSVVVSQATGTLGWGAFSLLASDYRTRRDQASSASDYRFYDTLSDRFGWGGVGLLTLAVWTYLTTSSMAPWVGPPRTGCCWPPHLALMDAPPLGWPWLSSAGSTDPSQPSLFPGLARMAAPASVVREPTEQIPTISDVPRHGVRAFQSVAPTEHEGVAVCQ